MSSPAPGAARAFTGFDYLRLWWIYTLVWVAGAVLVAWRSGPALAAGAYRFVLRD